MSSSSQTISSLLDVIGRSLGHNTLTKLVFRMFNERHFVEPYVLSGISVKAASLSHLELNWLEYNDENRVGLLDMAGQIFTICQSLSTLILRRTFTTAEEGKQVFEALASSQNATLLTFDCSYNDEWFDEQE